MLCGGGAGHRKLVESELVVLGSLPPPCGSWGTNPEHHLYWLSPLAVPRQEGFTRGKKERVEIRREIESILRLNF